MIHQQPQQQTLTDAMLKEFQSEDLQKFALAFLKFQHSSPVTNRRSFKYFKPLSEDELTDDEILYGEDRITAYDNLISMFQYCKFMKEFDQYFENKNLYWQSKTIPQLVILKEWL